MLHRFTNRTRSLYHKHNSVFSNCQAPADRSMYKQISQKDDTKMDLKETDGVVSTGIILLISGASGGPGPLMVLWVAQNVRNVLTS
jgi:hypothetical protein